MTPLKKLTTNIFSNYVGFFGAVVIAFLLSPFLVHTLGDELYGVWTIIAALTGYMALLDLGIGSAVAKYVSEYHRRDDTRALNAVLGAALLVGLCVAALLISTSPIIASLFVAFFGFTGELAETLRLVVIVASIDIAIFLLSQIVAGALMGFQRFEILNAVRLLLSIVKALLFWWLLSRGHGVLAMALVSLAINIAIGISFVLAMKRTYPHARFPIRSVGRSDIGRVVGFGKFTLLAMVAQQVVYYSDAFVIGYFLSAAFITYYTIAWSLGEYTNGLMLAICDTFFPLFSEQHAVQDHASIYRTYLTGTRFALVVSNLVCVGVLVLGDDFIGLWMGPSYAQECGVVLLIIFAMLLVKNPQGISMSLLLGTGNYRVFAWCYLLSAAVNLLLNIVLVQRYGIEGVAFGTLVTQLAFFGVLTPWLANRCLGRSLLDYYRRTYLRSVPSAALLYAGLSISQSYWPPVSYPSLLLQSVLMGAVYLVICYILMLDADEKRLVAEKIMLLTARLRTV